MVYRRHGTFWRKRIYCFPFHLRPTQQKAPHQKSMEATNNFSSKFLFQHPMEKIHKLLFIKMQKLTLSYNRILYAVTIEKCVKFLVAKRSKNGARQTHTHTCVHQRGKLSWRSTSSHQTHENRRLTKTRNILAKLQTDN